MTVTIGSPLVAPAVDSGVVVAKMQRRFVLGCEYHVEGVSEYGRRLRFVGRLKLGRKEHLVFAPVRKASKYRKSK
jgi:hypothetical protein